MDLDFEPFSDLHRNDPYPVYRALRDQAPVYWAEQSKNFVLSRYEDVAAVFKDTQTFSSNIDNSKVMRGQGLAGRIAGLRIMLGMMFTLRMTPSKAINSRFLIQTDGGVHSAMRDIVKRGFTPRRIGVWETRMREIAQECMTDLRDRRQGAGDRFDLIEKLAVPFPVRVISELLGIEPGRYEDFKRWSDTVARAAPDAGPENFLRSGVMQAMSELREYVMPVIRERRRSPQDDLISVIVAAQGKAALSDHEVFMFIFLLLIAGNLTTTNLLGNAVDALLAHPDELRKVVDDPSKIPALAEETLRWDAPVQFMQRLVKTDVELHGTRIPAGAEVLLLMGSANRDERRFPDPDRFDIDRDTRGHLGFGLGAHFCLGAGLARLEARVALEELVPELARLVRVEKDPEFIDSFVLRGRSRLELRAA